MSTAADDAATPAGAGGGAADDAAAGGGAAGATAAGGAGALGPAPESAIIGSVVYSVVVV